MLVYGASTTLIHWFCMAVFKADQVEYLSLTKNKHNDDLIAIKNYYYVLS